MKIIKKVIKESLILESKVQSVVFDKAMFTKEQAIEWLKNNHFSTATSRETTNTYRFRQEPRVNFNDFRTKVIGDGIKLIIGF